MKTHSDLHHEGSVIRYNSEILNLVEPRLFDVDWLKAEGHHRGSSAGRSDAHFLSFAGREMVLRPFRRGGLVGRFNRDLYLRTRVEAARPMQEFDLLNWMQDQGLPVPRPVAALMSPAGPFYRAAIITERIPDARPLEERLREQALSADVWSRVGAVIQKMHAAGVYHSDLNCRNILIDAKDQIWLIDFDKCERRARGTWQSDNLDRLLRSLRKVRGQGTELHWEEGDWDALLAGYDNEKSDGTSLAP